MGRPKAFLKLGSRTFAEHIASAIRAAAIRTSMIAVSQLDDKILQLCKLHALSPVINAATLTAVPLGSVQAAIKEVINRSVDGLLVWPVDYPHVRSDTAITLISAFLRSHRSIAIPVFERQRGHPVIFGCDVFDELLAAPPGEGARAVVRADRSRVMEVQVDDPAIIEDIDTPEDYKDLLRRQGLGTLPI